MVFWKVFERYRIDAAQLIIEELDVLPLVTTVVLLSMNYSLEAVKWNLLTYSIERVSFLRSLRTILIGQALNMIIPLAFGDFYARYRQFKECKSQSLGAIMVNRITLTIPTFIFGTVAVLYWMRLTLEGIELLWCIAISTVGVIILFLTIRLVKPLFLQKYASAIMDIKLSLLFKVQGLALARYIVFTIQYLLVFQALRFELTYIEMFLGVAWVFLIKTIIPAITLFGDLAKRQLSALAFFTLITDRVDLVIATSFLVWLINIVFPSFIGLIILPRQLSR